MDFTSAQQLPILIDMSERLQVLLDESEFAEIRRIAKRHHMTVAEWVRQALRAARRDEPATDPRRKLMAVREAARLLTVVAMAGLGLAVDLAAVRRVGSRVGATVLLSLLLMLGMSVALVRVLGLQ